MQRDSFLRSRGRNEIFLPARSVDVSLGTSFSRSAFATHPHHLNAIAEWKSIARALA